MFRFNNPAEAIKMKEELKDVSEGQFSHRHFQDANRILFVIFNN